jgi:3,4-dihydroxy 2-butanone 4-phosphate synthase
VDDFDRENEADLIAAAEVISVRTMAREGSGIMFLCLAEETLSRFEPPQMVSTTLANGAR